MGKIIYTEEVLGLLAIKHGAEHVRKNLLQKGTVKTVEKEENLSYSYLIIEDES